MNKEFSLSKEEVTTLIFATSVYLERLAKELQGYPNEKLSPGELRELAGRIETIANLRELLFMCRDEDKAIRFDVTVMGKQKA